MSLKIIIYHNPRWGKSREAVSLLKNAGAEIEVVEYLKQPLTKKELRALSRKLDLHPKEFIRKRESDFKEHNLKDTLDDSDALFNAIEKYPKIMERH